MKKTPAVVGTAGVLLRNSGRLGVGGCKTSGICEFDPSAFLKLYKIAHSEMAMYKSNNSASAVTRKQHEASIVKQKSPAFLGGASVGGKAKLQ
jgi:hypothetical protein